jgi:hypothetical protein
MMPDGDEPMTRSGEISRVPIGTAKTALAISQTALPIVRLLAYFNLDLDPRAAQEDCSLPPLAYRRCRHRV